MASPGIVPEETKFAERGREDESEDVLYNDREGDALEDPEVIRFVNAARWTEDTNRLEREKKWSDTLDLYMNRHNFDHKADWQSQLVISKAPNAVSTAIAILSAGVTATKRWYELSTPPGNRDEIDQELLPFFNDLFDAELDEKDHKGRAFLDVWLNCAVRSGLATAPVVMKIGVRPGRRLVRRFEVVAEERSQEPGIDDSQEGIAAIPGEQAGPGVGSAADGEMMQKLQSIADGVTSGEGVTIRSRMTKVPYVEITKESVDPFRYYRDHTGRGMYELQVIDGDASELEAWKDLPAGAGYRLAAIDRAIEKCTESSDDQAEDDKANRDDLNDENPAGRKTWSGVEYWGDIPGDDGRIVYEKYVATVVNDELVRLAKCPYDDERPFNYSCIEEIPHSEYGRGMLENGAGVARAITEFMNAVIDGAVYEVLKAFEIDLDQLVDASELNDGIRPGKTYTKRPGDQAGQPMISPLNTGSMPNSPTQVIAQLDRQFQEDTSVTEVSQGLGPVRGFPTATEIGARSEGTNTNFRGLAGWLERTSLEPALQSTFNRMVQFKIFGPGGRQWCEKVLGKKRYQEFELLILKRLVDGDGSFNVEYEFKVHALSRIAAKAQDLDRVGRLIELAETLPGFANRLRLDRVAETAVNALGFDGDDMTKSDEEMRQIAELEQRALQQATEGVGEQPNSNSGTNAAAIRAATPSGG